MKTLILVTLMLSTSALARKVPIVPRGTCTIETTATVGALDLEITGCQITGKAWVSDRKMRGEFTVELKKLDAGDLPLRTRHMQSLKFLNVEKFPKATLKLDPVLMVGSQEFTGMLTVKGKSKPVKGKIDFSATSATARFDVYTKDYGMPKMSYLGITLRERLDVKADISW